MLINPVGRRQENQRFKVILNTIVRLRLYKILFLEDKAKAISSK